MNMQQAIEASIAALQCIGQLVVIAREGLLEIERRNAGLGLMQRRDLRMHGFQLAHRSADEHQLGTMRGRRAGP